MPIDLFFLAKQIGQFLKAHHLTLAIAESCTGGQTAQTITSVAGSSQWFDRGFVTYSNLSKQEMLGVPAEILIRFGAVSEETARAMAEGALTHSRADVSVAITGIAGPEGGTPDKPVGTVWFAWAGKNRNTVAHLQQFTGDRLSIRNQATQFALEHLVIFLRIS